MCLRFGFLTPYWLSLHNTVTLLTFHEYFWCSWFCEFHSNNLFSFKNAQKPYYESKHETALKSSKSWLYLQDLLTLPREQGIGAASGRVSILWLTEHCILRWGNGKRRATFLESHSFGLKKLTSCTVLDCAFKLVQTLSVTQIKVFISEVQ